MITYINIPKFVSCNKNSMVQLFNISVMIAYINIPKFVSQKKGGNIIFLLSSRSKDKLMILFLLSYSNWTTTKLASKINSKRRYTKELLKELKLDTYHYLKQQLLIEVTLDGEVRVPDKNPEEIIRLFYRLKLAYLKETHGFKLLHLFLQKPSLSLTFISKHLFISLSYARRLIKNLNLSLQPFDFQIYDHKGVCELTGNELSIRLFLYVLMNDTYHSLPWPYATKDLPQYINSRQSLNIILTILTSRTDRQIVVPALNEKSTWIISQMKENYNFIPSIKIKNTFFEHCFDETILEDYFIFFTHICAPQAIPKEIKIALGKIFLYKTTDVSLFSRNLAYKIIEEFQLNYHKEKQYLLVYYLTVLDCYYEIMQQTTVLFEELVFPPLQYSILFEKPQVKKILLFLQEFLLEESHTEFLKNEKLQHYFCGLIYTILQIEKQPIVRIYIHFNKALTAQYLIQTRLEAIYNSKNIVFTPCFEQADLIVTDSLNFDREVNKEFIYFNTILKAEQWELLLQKINQLLLMKIATHERAFE